MPKISAEEAKPRDPSTTYGYGYRTKRKPVPGRKIHEVAHCAGRELPNPDAAPDGRPTPSSRREVRPGHGEVDGRDARARPSREVADWPAEASAADVRGSAAGGCGATRPGDGSDRHRGRPQRLGSPRLRAPTGAGSPGGVGGCGRGPRLPQKRPPSPLPGRRQAATSGNAVARRRRHRLRESSRPSPFFFSMAASSPQRSLTVVPSLGLS